MLHTIGSGRCNILKLRRIIFRLQEKVLKLHVFELRWMSLGLVLRVDQLDFVPTGLFHAGISFGADADPVETGRGFDRTIGFNADFEACFVKRIDSRGIELQEWLPACANDLGRPAFGAFGVPDGCNLLSKGGYGFELSAILTIRSDKVSIAK